MLTIITSDLKFYYRVVLTKTVTGTKPDRKTNGIEDTEIST